MHGHYRNSGSSQGEQNIKLCRMDLYPSVWEEISRLFPILECIVALFAPSSESLAGR